MASAACAVYLSHRPFYSQTVRRFHAIHISPSPTSFTMKTTLSSSKTLSTSLLFHSHSIIPSPKHSTFTVFAAKGYKMKTHKASAKRFRVTGRGKIVRRRAGKQHLLVKKNKKRKLRLSKMHAVDRSDYDNVIGALPYLKVNRQET
ncbi:50S ribosomal protein L35, chloroplastic [Phalaenopsis equestris]|uniref:50S ribosomal protein L35, chloroplastic n=1 Tax=Phalaenopsis equestris TaxID=78828 RepID=UPI0009E2D364|nr:50S ribosomal protein L35, chloroplastic [Phalaenopsis equestris]